MQSFKTILTVLAVASTVLAAPKIGTERTCKQLQQHHCGENQHLSCCHKGKCSALPLLNVVVGNQCGQSVACCDKQNNQQNGLLNVINVSNICVPIAL